MKNEIHSTAIVDPKAELEGVFVGPFCIVGPQVRLGEGTRLVSHVSIEGDTWLGKQNVVYPFATIGHPPQDLKYSNEPTRVRIGDRNQIRESVTIHRGTPSGHSETKIGSDGLFMANCHVAHDCIVGDHVIMANCASLAGHVEIDSHAILAGLTAVHQFCKIGERAFLSGGTMVAMDVPPFCTAEGRRMGLAGLNTVGLRRAGYNAERIATVKKIYREFFKLGVLREEALAKLTEIGGPDAQTWLAFAKRSTRGILRPLLDLEDGD